MYVLQISQPPCVETSQLLHTSHLTPQYVYLYNIHLVMTFYTVNVRVNALVFSLWETESYTSTFKCSILFLLSKNEVLGGFVLEHLLPWQQEHHKDFKQDSWHHLLLNLASSSYFQLIITLLKFNSLNSDFPCWVNNSVWIYFHFFSAITVQSNRSAIPKKVSKEYETK